MNTKMLFCLSPDFSKVTFLIEKKNIFEISIRFSSMLQHIISQSPNFAMIYMLPSSSRNVVAWNVLIFFASGKWYMVLETICFQETLLWLFRRSWTLSSLYSTLSFWIARHDFFKLLKMMLLKAEKTFKISPSSNKSTIQYLKTKQFHVYFSSVFLL